MRARNLAEAVMRAWESRDWIVLPSLLTNDFVSRGLLPQPIDKAQFLGFVQAIMAALPDWSFYDQFLNEGTMTELGERVLFVTQITGTHTGDLVLPDLPMIPPTGIRISLPYRHLEYFVKEEAVTAINADFAPTCLEEILAQMGMVLPQ